METSQGETSQEEGEGEEEQKEEKEEEEGVAGSTPIPSSISSSEILRAGSPDPSVRTNFQTGFQVIASQ